MELLLVAVAVLVVAWLAWRSVRASRKRNERPSDLAFPPPEVRASPTATALDRPAPQTGVDASPPETEPTTHTSERADDFLASPGPGYLPTALYVASEDEHPLPQQEGERTALGGVSEVLPAPPLRIVEADRPKQRRRQKQVLEVDKGDRLLFLDVETTGLSKEDRIVSIGMVRVLAGDLIDHGQSDSYGLAAETMHLVFNPERPSNPFAQRVHGWPDDVLSRQSPFADHATAITDMLKGSDVWIAHNLEFDLRFIRQEFRRLERPVPRRDTFCTMERARQVWEGQPAKLDLCIGRIGLARASERHGALEDALLCAALYTHCQIGKTFRTIPACGNPTNLR